MNATSTRPHRLSRWLALPALLAIAALGSGCAVYPYYPAAGSVAYGDPYGVPAAPVVVAPPPVYYGPAFYPSISIHGRFGDGRGHDHRGHRGHRGHRH